MSVNDVVSASRKFDDEIEKFRDPWESATHWHARKTFITENWAKYSSDVDRLTCLSTAWANVHFMGNRYPVKTMKEILAMEKDISEASNLVLLAEKTLFNK